MAERGGTGLLLWMVARWWVRFALWLRDGDGDDGGEAEWVIIFMKCTEKECVPDCGKCKKSKKAITYHFVERKV